MAPQRQTSGAMWVCGTEKHSREPSAMRTSISFMAQSTMADAGDNVLSPLRELPIAS